MNSIIAAIAFFTQISYCLASAQSIEKAMQTAIKAHHTPGGVICIRKNNKIVYHKAFGNQMLKPKKIPADLNHFYDLASLTKIYTATLIIRLHEAGQLNVEHPVGQYLKEFNTEDKKQILIRHLLTHRSGLPAATALRHYKKGTNAAIKHIASLRLRSTPGKKFIYSDLGPIVAGYLAEQVTKKKLVDLFQELIISPLVLNNTLPHPTQKNISLELIAPCNEKDGSQLQGIVHDPRARTLGGLAGNAGIFATAADVALFGQTFLDKPKIFLSQESFNLMTTAPKHHSHNSKRSLGFDINTGYSEARGAIFGQTSFGHTGFSGTSIWIDPVTQTVVVLLTNRLHPKGTGSIKKLRKIIGTLAATIT